MNDSKAYVLVTCNVPVRAHDTCSIDVLKNSFIFRVNGNVIPIKNVIINNENFSEFSGKILIEIDKSHVPGPNDQIDFTYNKQEDCSIVHRDYDFTISSKLDSFTHDTDTSNVITSVKHEQLPKIIKLDVPNVFAGKKIQAKITDFRNLLSSDTFDNFKITVTPSSQNINDDIIFSDVAILNNDKLEFNAIEGSIQRGDTYDISYSGDNIKDHFGLRMNTFTTAPVPCENSIEGLVFHSGSIETETPKKVFLKFKNPVTNEIIDLNDNLDSDYDNNLSKYKILKAITGVMYSSYTANNIVSLVLPGDTVRSIQITSPFVFKDTDKIGVSWDSKFIETKYRIKDIYGNDIFSTIVNPFSSKIINNIDGITINNSEVTTDYSSKYEIDISFKRKINQNEIVDISLDDANVTDFIIHNETSGFSFNPDDVLENTDGSIKLLINFNESDFTKTINIEDTITVDYVNSTWPSSLRDTYGNYMLPDTGFSTENNIDFGSVVTTIGENTLDKKQILINFDVDICGNTLQKEDFSIYSDNITDISILSVELSHPNTVLLNLSKIPDEESYLTLNKFSIKNKYGIYVKDFSKILITKTLNIISINAPDEDGGKNIYVELLESKDINGSNLSGFNITVNPNSNGLYNTVTFNSTGTLHSKNIIKFESTLGNIEKGASYNISYTAPEFGAIKDQLGFTLESFTTSPVVCVNNVKNLELLEGFIVTETPNKVYLKFKKTGSETPVNVGLPSGWPYNNSSDSYKFYVISDDETSILNTITYDIILVKTVIKEGVRCVELTLDENLNSNLNKVGVSWDSYSILNTKRIIDVFGNETFNSIHDPNNTVIDTTNLLRMQNRIDPITIREGSDLIITSDYLTKYEIILKFKRQISGSNIYCLLHPEAKASDFSIINVTEHKIFFANEIIDNNDGTILLRINFVSGTFDNTINKSDELLLKYNGGKTIIDKFNNKLEHNPDLRWNIINDIDFVGSVTSIEIKNENFNKIHINFIADICGNTIESDGSDFILSNGMVIESAVLNNENKKQVIITLQNSPTVIIDTKDVTISSSETNNIKNMFGLKTAKFIDQPIRFPELQIVSIKAPNNKGGKEIIMSFPNTNVSLRDVTNSDPGIPLALTQPFEDFSVSVVPNSIGTYISPEDIVFKAYLVEGDSNKNKIRLVAEKGQLQYGASYNISYTGTVIKDQYDSRLEQFITAPVLCENLTGRLLFKEGSVELSTPKKIKFNFKSIIPITSIVSTIDSIDLKDNFNNYTPPVNAFVAHIDNRGDFTTKNVINVNNISYNGNVGLEFELDEPIKHNDIVSIEWNNTNGSLPIDKRIMDTYGNEAFDSRHDPLAGEGVNNSHSIFITNHIDGIIIKEDINLSMNVIDNKTSVTVKFKRITSGNDISCSLVNENLSPEGDDFVILRNGVEVIPDELIDNNDGTILKIRKYLI